MTFAPNVNFVVTAILEYGYANGLLTLLLFLFRSSSSIEDIGGNVKKGKDVSVMAN